jgi:hypothetical protein
VPTIALVDGVRIRLYNDDHPPAHFHAAWAEHQAVIAIGSLRVVRGYLPKAQLRKVINWAAPRKRELLAAWEACQAGESPGRVK